MEPQKVAFHSQLVAYFPKFGDITGNKSALNL
jgi:hypothetical protein